MSRRPAVVLALLAALLAPVAPASAVPKATTAAGTVRIFATQPVTIDLRLPKPVNIGDGYRPPAGTTVTGAGRTIGAMLMAADLSLTAMEAIRYTFCEGAGCTSKYSGVWFHGRDNTPQVPSVVLPAGDYRLAIVTDGKPVAIVLKFPGLRGTIDLRPTRPLNVKHTQTAFVGATGTGLPGTYYSGASDVDVDGGTGVVLYQMLVETDGTAQQEGAFCTYSGAVRGEPAPGCPGGSGTEITVTQLKLEPHTWGMTGRWKFAPEGKHRAGGYYRTVGVAYDPVGTVTTVVIPPRLK